MKSQRLPRAGDLGWQVEAGVHVLKNRHDAHTLLLEAVCDALHRPRVPLHLEGQDVTPFELFEHHCRSHLGDHGYTEQGV